MYFCPFSAESFYNFLSLIDDQRDMAFSRIVGRFALRNTFRHCLPDCNRDLCIEFPVLEIDRGEFNILEVEAPRAS